MQKAIKMIVLGMGMGMVVDRFVLCKMKMTDEPNCSCSCSSSLETATTSENEKSYIDLAKDKVQQLVDEFDKIDLSEVKEKTKKALDKFKQKLQSF